MGAKGNGSVNAIISVATVPPSRFSYMEVVFVFNGGSCLVSRLAS